MPTNWRSGPASRPNASARCGPSCRRSAMRFAGRPLRRGPTSGTRPRSAPPRGGCRSALPTGATPLPPRNRRKSPRWTTYRRCQTNRPASPRRCGSTWSLARPGRDGLVAPDPDGRRSPRADTGAPFARRRRGGPGRLRGHMRGDVSARPRPDVGDHARRPRVPAHGCHRPRPCALRTLRHRRLRAGRESLTAGPIWPPPNVRRGLGPGWGMATAHHVRFAYVPRSRRTSRGRAIRASGRTTRMPPSACRPRTQAPDARPRLDLVGWPSGRFPRHGSIVGSRRGGAVRRHIGEARGASQRRATSGASRRVGSADAAGHLPNPGERPSDAGSDTVDGVVRPRWFRTPIPVTACRPEVFEAEACGRAGSGLCR